jgi:hypothetical protein
MPIRWGRDHLLLKVLVVINGEAWINVIFSPIALAILVQGFLFLYFPVGMPNFLSITHLGAGIRRGIFLFYNFDDWLKKYP